MHAAPKSGAARASVRDAPFSVFPLCRRRARRSEKSSEKQRLAGASCSHSALRAVGDRSETVRTSLGKGGERECDATRRQETARHDGTTQAMCLRFGEGKELVSDGHTRPASCDYMEQCASAALRSGCAADASP